MTHLNGRVFARLQQYDALPTQLKQQVEALEKYLTLNQSEVFGSHRTMHLKSVYGVRTRPLLEKIEAWVKQHGQSVSSDSGQDASSTERVPTPTPTPATSIVNRYPIDGSEKTAPETTPAHTDPKADAHVPDAKELLDALVLKGFVTPHKEEKPDEDVSATEDLEFKNNELLATRSPDAKKTGPTVWDLVDGAVFAGMLKRKAGLLEALTHGKDVYAIVNMRVKSLTLFSSDLGREPVAQFDADKLKVAFDKSYFDYGVRVWNETESELLNAANEHESDALMQALLVIGATHREHNVVETTPEKLRHEVKEHAVGGDHEQAARSYDVNKKSLGDPHYLKPTNAGHTETTSTVQLQHKGWDRKTSEDTTPLSQPTLTTDTVEDHDHAVQDVQQQAMQEQYHGEMQNQQQRAMLEQHLDQENEKSHGSDFPSQQQHGTSTEHAKRDHGVAQMNEPMLTP